MDKMPEWTQKNDDSPQQNKYIFFFTKIKKSIEIGMALQAADWLGHSSGNKLGMLHKTSPGAKKQKEQMS